MAEEIAAGASAEMYLKTISELTGEAGLVPISSLAGRLTISPVSATEMVHRLEAQGLVQHVPYRGVRLTAEGRRRALQVVRNHRVWEQFLAQDLSLPWDEVHDLACRLEHAAGPKVTDALASRLSQPSTCPHGNPIPGPGGSVRRAPGRRLDRLAVGDKAVIQRIWPETGPLLEHLSERGVRPGIEVEVLAIDPFDGPRQLRLGGRRVTLGREAAERVIVRVRGRKG